MNRFFLLYWQDYGSGFVPIGLGQNCWSACIVLCRYPSDRRNDVWYHQVFCISSHIGNEMSCSVLFLIWEKCLHVPRWKNVRFLAVRFHLWAQETRHQHKDDISVRLELFGSLICSWTCLIAMSPKESPLLLSRYVKIVDGYTCDICDISTYFTTSN